MDINQVLTEYDGMFGVHTREEIEAFLIKNRDAANAEGDSYSELTLLNEMVGFYRDAGLKEKGLVCCKQVIEMLDTLHLNGTVEYATSLLNVANAYRAFGLHNRSLKLHNQVQDIYKQTLPENAFHYASLYNNWSLLYQEMEDFENATVMLKKALAVVDTYSDAVIQQATTRSNLAATLLRLSQSKTDKEAEKIYHEAIQYLQEALKIYEADGGKDFHYSAALSAMGDACYMKKRYEMAAEYYKRAMAELEKHVGKTEAYERVQKNYEQAVKHLGKLPDVTHTDVRVCQSFKNNMERCKAFYEEYGKKMLHEKYPAYEKRIAVGLVGEGSDCFGFDDSISMDHDYGIGFCLWVVKEDFEKIGASLQNDYVSLIAEHGAEFLKKYHEMELEESVQKFMDSRRGVFVTEQFYEDILGTRIEKGDTGYLSENSWLLTTEDKLATAVNGEVFRDDYGAFSEIREYLKAYYPENIWLYRLAEKVHDFSQYAQSNYARMMARKDSVTAGICVAKGIQSAMEIAYLLNHRYAPYYKWMRRGMEHLELLRGMIPVLDEISLMGNQADAWMGIDYDPYKINRKDKIVIAFEKLAEMILTELNKQRPVNGTDLFLDQYCMELINQTGAGKNAIEKHSRSIESNTVARNSLIEKIVKLEWAQFDKVKNEGGRADCQDDWNTFSIMRRSQYMAWPDALLNSFYSDLTEADQKGWNLIMEKYARMMESTAPERYEELKATLPVRNEKRLAIQEEIIKIQVAWMEELAKNYPKLAGNARSIHTAEDNAYNTSYETYLRGEIGTYSEETLLLYGKFIVELSQKGDNLAYLIMEHTVHLYGYDSLEDAEGRL